MRILVTLAALPVMALLIMALARIEAGLDRPLPERRPRARTVRLRVPFLRQAGASLPDERVGA